MIATSLSSTFSGAQVIPALYDPTSATASIGNLAMGRSTRDGRNPAVGARGSKRYGLSMIFKTEILPLHDSANQPIY